MTTPFTPARVGRVVTPDHEDLLEAADPGYVPPLEGEGLSDEELLLESIPAEITQPEVGPSPSELLRQGMVYDIESGEFVEPEDAVPSDELKGYQSLMNNQYQRKQADEGETGWLDTPVEVSGYYNQDQIDATIAYRERVMGMDAKDARYSVDTGTLFGNEKEDTKAFFDSLYNEGNLRPPKTLSGEWLLSPGALGAAKSELAESLIKDMVREDTTLKPDDIRPGVLASLDVYEVAGAGNWTRTWLDAYNAVKDGDATEMDKFVHSVGAQLYPLDLGHPLQKSPEYASPVERLKKQAELEGEGVVSPFHMAEDIEAHIPLGPMDYIPQDVVRIEGTMFRFPDKSPAQVAEIISEWAKDPSKSAEEYAARIHAGLEDRRSAVMENRWTDADRNMKGEAFNIFDRPDMFAFTENRPIHRGAPLSPVDAPTVFRSRASGVVDGGIQSMTIYRDYAQSGVPVPTGLSAADRLLVLMSSVDLVGKYPLLYEAWQEKEVEAAERGLIPEYGVEDKGVVSDRMVGGDYVLRAMERELEGGVDPFVSGTLSSDLLSLLDAHTGGDTYSKLERYKSVLAALAADEGVALIDSGPKGSPRVNPELSEEVRNMYMRMYKPLAKLYTDELGKSSEDIEEKFHAHLSYAVDILEKPSRGYGDEAATWMAEKLKQTTLGATELMYGGSEAAAGLWGDYTGISPERQAQVRGAAAKARARSQAKLMHRRDPLMAVVTDTEPVTALTATGRAGVGGFDAAMHVHRVVGLLAGTGDIAGTLGMKETYVPRGYADLVQTLQGRTGLDDLQLSMAMATAQAAGDDEGVAAIESERAGLRAARTQLPQFDMMGDYIMRAESIDVLMPGLQTLSFGDLPKHVDATAPTIEDFEAAIKIDPTLELNEPFMSAMTRLDDGDETLAHQVPMKWFGDEYIRRSMTLGALKSAVEFRLEAREATGVATIDFVSSAMMEAMYEPIYKGGVRYKQETTVGAIMRVAGGGLQAPVIVAGRNIAQQLGFYDKDVTTEGYDGFLGLKDEWYEGLAMVALGHGAMEAADDFIWSYEMDNKSGTSAALRSFGLASDFLAPWEPWSLKMFTKPVTWSYRVGRTAAAMPSGGRLRGAGIGASPWIYAKAVGLKDTDYLTSYFHGVKTAVAANLKSGMDPHEVIGSLNRGVVEEVYRAIGIDPENVRNAVEQHKEVSLADGGLREAIESTYKDPTPEMEAVRESPEYKAVVQGFMDAVEKGNLTETQAVALVALWEFKSQQSARFPGTRVVPGKMVNHAPDGRTGRWERPMRLARVETVEGVEMGVTVDHIDGAEILTPLSELMVENTKGPMTTPHDFYKSQVIKVTGEEAPDTLPEGARAAGLEIPVSTEVFYSAVETGLAKVWPKGAKSAKGPWLLNKILGQAKKAEVRTMGLDRFLKTKERFTFDEVADYIRSERLRVEILVKGAKPDLPTRREVTSLERQLAEVRAAIEEAQVDADLQTIVDESGAQRLVPRQAVASFEARMDRIVVIKDRLDRWSLQHPLNWHRLVEMMWEIDEAVQAHAWPEFKEAVEAHRDLSAPPDVAELHRHIVERGWIEDTDMNAARFNLLHEQLDGIGSTALQTHRDLLLTRWDLVSDIWETGARKEMAAAQVAPREMPEWRRKSHDTIVSNLELLIREGRVAAGDDVASLDMAIQDAWAFLAEELASGSGRGWEQELKDLQTEWAEWSDVHGQVVMGDELFVDQAVWLLDNYPAKSELSDTFAAREARAQEKMKATESELRAWENTDPQSGLELGDWGQLVDMLSYVFTDLIKPNVDSPATRNMAPELFTPSPVLASVKRFWDSWAQERAAEGFDPSEFNDILQGADFQDALTIGRLDLDPLAEIFVAKTDDGTNWHVDWATPEELTEHAHIGGDAETLSDAQETVRGQNQASGGVAVDHLDLTVPLKQYYDWVVTHWHQIETLQPRVGEATIRGEMPEELRALRGKEASIADRISELGRLSRQQDAPKWASYRQSGGANYREFVVRDVGDAEYAGSTTHFGESGILFFIQATDRIDADGNVYLHIETLQSDAHQQFRDDVAGRGVSEDIWTGVDHSGVVAEVEKARQFLLENWDEVLRPPEPAVVQSFGDGGVRQADLERRQEVAMELQQFLAHGSEWVNPAAFGPDVVNSRLAEIQPALDVAWDLAAESAGAPISDLVAAWEDPNVRAEWARERGMPPQRTIDSTDVFHQTEWLLDMVRAPMYQLALGTEASRRTTELSLQREDLVTELEYIREGVDVLEQEATQFLADTFTAVANEMRIQGRAVQGTHAVAALYTVGDLVEEFKQWSGGAFDPADYTDQLVPGSPEMQADFLLDSERSQYLVPADPVPVRAEAPGWPTGPLDTSKSNEMLEWIRSNFPEFDGHVRWRDGAIMMTLDPVRAGELLGVDDSAIAAGDWVFTVDPDVTTTLTAYPDRPGFEFAELTPIESLQAGSWWELGDQLLEAVYGGAGFELSGHPWTAKRQASTLESELVQSTINELEAIARGPSTQMDVADAIDNAWEVVAEREGMSKDDFIRMVNEIGDQPRLVHLWNDPEVARFLLTKLEEAAPVRAEDAGLELVQSTINELEAIARGDDDDIPAGEQRDWHDLDVADAIDNAWEVVAEREGMSKDDFIRMVNEIEASPPGLLDHPEVARFLLTKLEEAAPARLVEGEAKTPEQRFGTAWADMNWIAEELGDSWESDAQARAAETALSNAWVVVADEIGTTVQDLNREWDIEVEGRAQAGPQATFGVALIREPAQFLLEKMAEAAPARIVEVAEVPKLREYWIVNEIRDETRSWPVFKGNLEGADGYWDPEVSTEGNLVVFDETLRGVEQGLDRYRRQREVVQKEMRLGKMPGRIIADIRSPGPPETKFAQAGRINLDKFDEWARAEHPDDASKRAFLENAFNDLRLFREQLLDNWDDMPMRPERLPTQSAIARLREEWKRQLKHTEWAEQKTELSDLDAADDLRAFIRGVQHKYDTWTAEWRALPRQDRDPVPTLSPRPDWGGLLAMTRMVPPPLGPRLWESTAVRFALQRAAREGYDGVAIVNADDLAEVVLEGGEDLQEYAEKLHGLRTAYDRVAPDKEQNRFAGNAPGRYPAILAKAARRYGVKLEDVDLSKEPPDSFGNPVWDDSVIVPKGVPADIKTDVARGYLEDLLGEVVDLDRPMPIDGVYASGPPETVAYGHTRVPIEQLRTIATNAALRRAGYDTSTHGWMAERMEAIGAEISEFRGISSTDPARYAELNARYRAYDDLIDGHPHMAGAIANDLAELAESLGLTLDHVTMRDLVDSFVDRPIPQGGVSELIYRALLHSGGSAAEFASTRIKPGETNHLAAIESWIAGNRGDDGDAGTWLLDRARRVNIDAARSGPPPRPIESADIINGLVVWAGGKIGANAFDATAIKFNDKMKKALAEGPTPLWMSKKGTKQGSFEVEHGGGPEPVKAAPTTATIEAGITGYRPEFPLAHQAWTDYKETIERIKELEESDAQSPELVELRADAAELIDEVYYQYEPDLVRMLTNDLPPGLISIQFRRGTGVWNGDPSEANVVLHIDYPEGDELARDIIIGRLAQFSRGFEQGGLLFREKVGRVGAAIEPGVFDGSVEPPAALLYPDAGGTNRAATAVIDLNSNPAIKASHRMLLDEMSGGMGATHDPDAGTLTIAHTPEWADEPGTPRKHLDKVLAFIHGVRKKLGNLDVDFYRENVYVAEPVKATKYARADGTPIGTSAATPRTGYLWRTYDYEQLIFLGLEAELEATQGLGGLGRGPGDRRTVPGRGGEGREAAATPEDPGRGPRRRPKRPGSKSNRRAKLDAAGVREQPLKGFKAKGSRRLEIDPATGRESWSSGETAYKKVGRNDYQRHPAKTDADKAFRSMEDAYGQDMANITDEHVYALADELGVSSVEDWNRAMVLTVSNYVTDTKKGRPKLPKSVRDFNSEAAGKTTRRKSTRAMTPSQRYEFSKWLAYLSLYEPAYGGLPGQLTVPQTLSDADVKALDLRITGETKPSNVIASLKRVDQAHVEHPAPFASDVSFERFAWAVGLGGNGRTLRRPPGTVKFMDPANVAAYIHLEPRPKPEYLVDGPVAVNELTDHRGGLDLGKLGASAVGADVAKQILSDEAQFLIDALTSDKVVVKDGAQAAADALRPTVEGEITGADANEAIENGRDALEVAYPETGLTPSMYALQKHGEAVGKEFRRMYAAGEMSPTDTGQLFLWGILSRRLSPYPHEGMFVDTAMAGVRPFVEMAARGEFTKDVLGPTEMAGPRKKIKYKDSKGEKQERWETEEETAARRQVVVDSGDTYAAFLQRTLDNLDEVGSPGVQARGNLHDFGRHFLFKMNGEVKTGDHAGKPALQVLHDGFASNMTGPELRRLFVEIKPGKVGLDLKVVSFIILVTGRDDVLVLDRVQSGLQMDYKNPDLVDNVYGTDNIYEGYQASKAIGRQQPYEWGPWSPSRGISNALSDARGLALYEAMENAVSASVAEGYRLLGREGEGTLRTFHWEGWVVDSGQEVSHSSLEAMLRIARGEDDPMVGTTVRQGKMDTYVYGIEYVAMPDGQRRFVVRDSTNKPYIMNRAEKDDYVARISSTSKKDRIIPTGYKVSEVSGPWHADIDRAKVDSIIREVGNAPTADELDIINNYTDSSGRALGTETQEAPATGMGDDRRFRSRSGINQPIDPVTGFSLSPADIARDALVMGDPPGELSRALYAELGVEIVQNPDGSVKDTTETLKIYNLDPFTEGKTYAEVLGVLEELSKKEGSLVEGWSHREFGPAYSVDGEPVMVDGKHSKTRQELTKHGYPQKVAWLYSPHHAALSFKDPQYTLVWRWTHEIAHGLVNDDLTVRYDGQGRRMGALGIPSVHPYAGFPVPPRSLADALRAVDWEHFAFIKQREILSELGIEITDKQFAQEYMLNMADAVHRALTGKFSEPGELGFDISEPVTHDVMRARAKHVIARHAEKMGMDMNMSQGGPDSTIRKDYTRRTLFQDEAGEIRGMFESEVPPARSMTSMDSAKFLLTFFESADFDTFLHEGGHLMAEIMGKEWRDAFMRSGFELDQDGRPTRKGHEQIADAWRYYAATRLAANGRLKHMFDTLWSTGLRDLWVRMRGKPEMQNLPPEMVHYWDSALRPDQIVMPMALRSNAERVAGKIPVIKVSGDPGVRVKEARVQRRQKAKEWAKVNTKQEDVRQALGIKVGDEISLDELVSRVVAYVMTEKARRMFGVGDLVAMTNRTIVPASRVKRIQEDVSEVFAAHMGTPPQKFIKDNADAKTGTIILSGAQGRSLRALAEEVAVEPMGSKVPGRLLDPRSDLSVVSFEEINALQEASIDIHAGVAARRDQKAEAVPRNLSKALLSALTSIPEFVASKTGNTWLASKKRTLQEIFVIRDEFGDYIDPGMKADIEAMLRDIGEVQNWAKRSNAAILKSGANPEKAIMATLDEMRRMLNPAISVENGNSRALADARNKFNSLRDDGRPTLIPHSIRALTDSGFLSQIRGIFRDGGGFFVDGSGSTMHERVALDLLAEFGERINREPYGRGEMFLSDAETVQIADALDIVKHGLDKRYELMTERGGELAIALGGSVDKNVLLGLGDAAKIRIYEKFYSGRWLELADEVPALESGLEEFKIPSVERAQVVLEMIIRMRANEVLAGFSEQLARRGLLHTYDSLTADFPIGGAYRDGYVDNVVHFLNQEASGMKSIVVEEGVGPMAAGSIKPAPSQAAYTASANMPIASSAHAKKAYIDAQEIMRTFGFKSFKGQWVRYTFPDGSEAVIPAMVAEAIAANMETAADIGRAYGSARTSSYSGRLERLKKGGEPSGLTVEQEARIGTQTRPLGQVLPFTMADAIRTMMGSIPGMGIAINVGLTVGPLILTPAYFVGNLLGAQFQVYAKTGPLGLISANFGEPKMTTAVVKRLWGAGRDSPSGAMVVTKDGRVYTADMLAAEAQRRGLDSSFIQAETIESIAAELSRTHHSAVRKIADAPRGLVNIYTEVATASDNYYRVGTFISELKNGRSLDEAAATARSALYDYGALTDIEKKVFRHVMLFYSFQRKNMDLFIDTLLTNPHRLAGQIRLANWLQEEFLEEDPEIVLPDYYRARLVASFKDAVVNHATDAGVATMMPPLPIADVLYIMADMADTLGAVTGDKPPGGRADFWGPMGGLVSKASPYVQLPFTMATGVDVYYQRDLDDSFNTVPPWFVELDQNLFGGYLADLIDLQLVDLSESSKAHLRPTDSSLYGWRAGNGRVWWMIRNAHMVPGLGRSMDTVTQLDRANIGVVEFAVRQSRLYRDVYSDLGLVEPRDPSLYDPYVIQRPPKRSSAERAERAAAARRAGVQRDVPEETPSWGRPIGDTESPRWGYTWGQELAHLFGLRKTIVPTKERAYDKMAAEALRQLEEAERREN